MADIPRRRTSTTVSGLSTSTFIRSTSVVPPARNIAPARAATALAASDAPAARSNVKGFMKHLPDRGHDVGICRTAAQIAAHPLADLLVGQRRGVDRLLNVRRNVTRHALVDFTNGADRREDLPGRAVPALQAVAVQEGGLHRVKLAAGRETFDGDDVLPLACRRQCQTGQDALAVYNHRARPAGALIAALLRSGQSQLVA